jgi:hypothetical protein
MNNQMIKKSYPYLLLLLSLSVFSQQKQLETSIDTTKNKIGAQFTLTLKANVKRDSKVVFPNSKSFGALEVIESYPVDTVKSDSKYELIKKYGLTQFDSGRYVIPRLSVLIDRNPIFSDSIQVEVTNIAVDTLKQKMYDIKPIILVKKPAGEWWKYVLGFLLLFGLLVAVYFLLKKFKKQPVKEIVYNSPIEKATSLLQLLEKKEFLQKGEIKNYYSELTDIARDYIEEAIEIPAKESTTSELIVALRAVASRKKMKLSKESLLNLEKVLKQADLVKFAKSKPLDFEIADDREKIEKTIVLLDKSIPVVVDENSKKWELLQQEIRLKKEKQKKRIAIAAIFVFLLVGTVTYFTVTKGIDYVKNGFSGYSTTELLHGDWILSDYGNPSVVIETPKVLKRLDVKKAVPQDAMALIKDMQMFGYGSLLGRFNIIVSTIQFKKETQIDLAASLDGTIHTLEAQDCQNIITKQAEFTTEKGVKGIKGFGTMSYRKQKMYFEILLFSQAGGLQQIMIVHKEGDSNAEKIAERMLNSVELKIAN